MNQMQLREAKAKLSALVDAAERGETTIITRHGKAVARVVPIEQEKQGGHDVKKPSFAEWLLSMPGEIPVDRDRRPFKAPDFD